jgi:MoaA/NifB/PqqE/SkfB family radical SAM enzyme
MITSINLYTTFRCDLNCQHCLRGIPQDDSDFPIEMLDNLLSQAVQFGTHHIFLTGGEPYFHPGFSRIIEMITHYGYTWGFVSNGQSIEPYLTLMERYKNQFKVVHLSIDAPIQSLHDELRGCRGAFTKVIASVKSYVKHGFRVWAQTSLNQKNKGEIQTMIALGESLGIEGIRFGGTIPTERNQHLLLSDGESLALYQQIMSFRKITKLEIKTTSSLYLPGGINFCDILNLYHLTFSPKGELNFCCDVNQPNGIIGSLYEHSLAALIKKWLEQSAQLQSNRVKRITSGRLGEGFNTCAFCNDYFKNKCPALAERDL